MARYDFCLVPDEVDTNYHNWKVFHGDKIVIYLRNGSRLTGKVTQFMENAIILKTDSAYCTVQLCDIKDVSVISRADGRTDWR